ncbi:PREDICTED: defense protein l(2)34Fc-like [Priapulus caudatus]|uniref:Defense protein l(2)34Fc-like n=1 Tax=Priapulus caudatus TaxID=37621 RepID=A0ABM1E0K9_PRICU|nr:PREDICTED: defense protein l(2)34Fc-like [Priapulus caudatus]
MHARVLCAVTVTFALIASVAGYPDGAPDTACDNLQPKHGTNAQTSSPPFSIDVDSTSYAADQMLAVTVRGGPRFEGLMLQAQDSNNDPVGSFTSVPNGLKTLQCGGTTDTVTQSSKSRKTTKTVTFRAPSSDVGNIKFVATVVQSYSKYWMVVSDCISGPSGTSTGCGGSSNGGGGGADGQSNVGNGDDDDDDDEDDSDSDNSDIDSDSDDD